MVQESIGLECEQEIIAMLNNVQCLQGTHRTGRLALRRSKTAEVMFAHQPVGGLAHACQVERMLEIGRAHVCTPVTNAHLVCRLLLENKQLTKNKSINTTQKN